VQFLEKLERNSTLIQTFALNAENAMRFVASMR